MSLISSQLGRALSNSTTANMGSRVSRAAAQHATDTASGIRRGITKTVRRGPHPGSLAGLHSAGSAHIDWLDGGYYNPTNQIARNRKRALVPEDSARLTTNSAVYNRTVDYHRGLDKTRSSSLLRNRMNK